MANVSTATVSRALRFPEQVSPPLVARVAAAVAKLEYVPAASARALSTLRTGVVGVLVRDVGRYASIVSGAIARLASVELGARLVRCDEPATGEAARALADDDVEGLIVIGLRLPVEVLETFHRRGVACSALTVGAPSSGQGVCVDLPAAAYTGAAHLAAVGCRAAVLACDHDADTVALAWLAELRAALTGRDIGIQEAVGNCPAERMMGWKRRTAVLCSSDLLAAQTIGAIQRVRMRVPEDIMCLGFGDEAFASFLSPSLTTVRMPGHRIGRQLVEGLLAARAGASPSTIAIVPKLVLRRSTVSRETSAARFT